MVSACRSSLVCVCVCAFFSCSAGIALWSLIDDARIIDMTRLTNFSTICNMAKDTMVSFTTCTLSWACYENAWAYKRMIVMLFSWLFLWCLRHIFYLLLFDILIFFLSSIRYTSACYLFMILFMCVCVCNIYIC